MRYKLSNILMIILLTISCETIPENQRNLRKIGLLKGHTQSEHEAFAKKVMVASQGKYKPKGL